MISPKSLELVTGMATKVGAQTIQMRQDTVYEKDKDGNMVDKGDLYPLTATADGSITLAHTPKEAAADVLVYLAEDDCGTPLVTTDATLSDKTLKVAAAAGKKVVVYYTYESSANTETYTVDASKFSGTYKLVGDTVLRNANTGKIYVYVFNAKCA